MDWPLWMYLVLSVTAFVAGFVSSIAGAGGLIVLPVLLWAGVPPLNALAVNKFQSVFGTLSSTINFFSKGHLDFKSNKLGLLCAFLASLVGTWLVQRLGNDVLLYLLPWLLLLLAGYFAMSSDISDQPRPAVMSNKVFNLTVASGLGFYGGFFGPGMGSFYAAAFASLRGLPMVLATAHTKPFVLIVNTTSMLVFIFAGYQWWSLAILMAAMQFMGARIGSNMVIKRGARLIKPLLVVVTLLMVIKLIAAA